MRLRICGLLMGLLLLAVSCTQPAEEGSGQAELPDSSGNNQQALIRKMDAWLTKSAEQGFSGSVMVAKDGEVLLSRGYGMADRENKVPITPGTIFTTGSISKQFTGAAVMKLVELGKLNVQQTLGEFFPEAPDSKKNLTLHQLLSHSSGFPGAIGSDYQSISAEEFRKQAFASEPRFDEGTTYHYSNVGYTLLAMIIEQVSGQEYEAFLQEHLFGPAGMKHTGYTLPDWSGRVVAHGYRAGIDWGTLPEKWAEMNDVSWHLKGNGGILSTVEDLHRWHNALENGKILKPESIKIWQTPHVAENPEGESHYGYGWAIFQTPRNTTLVTHNGGNGIFFADMLRLVDEGVMICFMTNAYHNRIDAMAWRLERMMFDTEYQPDVPDIRFRKLEKPSDDHMGRTIAGLLDLIGTEGADIKGFVTENIHPDKQQYSERIERHLGEMQRVLNKAELKEIHAYTGNTFEVILNSPNGTEMIYLRFQDNKIATIRF